MVDLPLILAGPIVRRVELTSASFWIATSKSASVRAQVYDLGGNAVKDATAATRPFGDNMHVVVVTVPFDGPLAPGQIYSYDIFVDGVGLKAAGLLEDKPASGAFPGQLALGYVKDRLPSFVTPAFRLQDLRLAHASCRKTNGPGYDATGWLDDHIAANLNQALKRPQQLFLTGDQIYADEVAPCLLPMLTELGRDLLGAGKSEYIPIDADTSCRCTTAHLPAMRRQLLVRDKGGFTSTGAHNHLIGFGEYAAMYLAVWSPRVWRTMATLDQLYVPTSAAQSPAHEWLTPWETCDEYVKAGGWRKATSKETEEEIHRAEVFRAAVPKVARLLANVATYMQFDDHEVTDDWNLNHSWSNRVYNRPLGAAIVRNAVMAETIFQAWGNDPAAYTAGKNKEFLDNAALVANAPEPGLVPVDVDNKLKTLMGAGGGGAAEQARWHFTVSGPVHVVAVTDSRTHRKFTGQSVRPPSLLGDTLASQIPASLPAGMELLIVVSPAPVLSPTLFESIAQPIIQGVRDTINGQRKQKFHKSCHPGGPVWGWEDYDGEGWGANEEALEDMLLHLAKHGKVVILSGDVHYSTSLALDLWQKDVTKPARIVQLTCSSARNDMKPILQALVRDNACLQEFQAGLAAERLAWRSGDLTLTFPRGADGKPPKVALGRLARAKRTPALLPARGWPAGTTANKVIDWCWRMQMARDARTNAQVPAGHMQPGLNPPGDVNPAQDRLGSYAKVVSRHVVAAMTHFDHLRQMVFNTNVGLVAFTGAGSDLKVVHTILSHNGVKDVNKADEATIHEVPLVTPQAEKPPSFPPVQP